MPDTCLYRPNLRSKMYLNNLMRKKYSIRMRFWKLNAARTLNFKKSAHAVFTDAPPSRSGPRSGARNWPIYLPRSGSSWPISGYFFLFQIDFCFSDCKNNSESRDPLVKIKYFRQKTFALLFVTTVVAMRLMTISRHGLIC